MLESTQWACHLTHSLLLLKDSSGVKDWSDLSLLMSGILVLDRNYCTSGSSLWGYPKSSGSSAQDCGQEPVASRPCLPPEVGGGACFTSVSLLGLDSSKATHLLSLTGLSGAAHLFAGSPVWFTAEGTCSSWPASGHLLWLLVCPLLPKHQQLPDWCQLLDHPWEVEWASLLMWPSKRVAATIAQLWTSWAILKASSCDSCHLFWKWWYTSFTLAWNSAWAVVLWVLAPNRPCLGSSSGRAEPCLCQRCSFNESRISWWISSFVSRSHSTVALFNW